MKYFSLKNRLIINMLLVGLIPTFIVAFLVISRVKTVALKPGNTRITGVSALETIVDLKLERINSYLIERKADMESVRTRDFIANSFQTLENYKGDINHPKRLALVSTLDTQLDLLLSSYHYLDVMLIDLNRNVIYVHNKTHRLTDLNRPLYDATGNVFKKGKKRVFFSQFFLNERDYNGAEFMISGPVMDVKGRLLGEVVFEISAEDLLLFIQTIPGLGDTGEIFIVQRAKTGVEFLTPPRFAPTASFKKFIRYDDPSGVAAQLATQEGTDGSGLILDYRGIPVLAAWRHIPLTHWGIVAKIDQTEILKPIESLMSQIYFVIVLSSLFIVVFAIIAAMRISTPLVKITRAINDLANGQLNIKLEGMASKDELGDLARAFEKMRVSLKILLEEYKKKGGPT